VLGKAVFAERSTIISQVNLFVKPFFEIFLKDLRIVKKVRSKAKKSLSNAKNSQTVLAFAIKIV